MTRELVLRPLRLEDWEAVHGWARFGEHERHRIYGTCDPRAISPQAG